MADTWFMTPPGRCSRLTPTVRLLGVLGSSYQNTSLTIRYSRQSTDKSAKLTSGEAPFEPRPLCSCSWAELQPHSIRCIAACLIGIRYWITSSSDLPSDRQGVPLLTCVCAHLWHPCLSRKCEGQQGRVAATFYPSIASIYFGLKSFIRTFTRKGHSNTLC